jgi:hypothetical protein
MFGCEEKAQARPRISECRAAGLCTITRAGEVEISPMGEEEVEVTESEVR